MPPRLISADSHVNEPPEMFGERLPAALRPRAPRVETVGGVDCLVMEGMRPRKMPRGREALTGEALARAQAGGWEPSLRIRDQERDGVAGEVVFPTLALQACFMAPDAELQLALARAYNDWVAEVFTPHPDRFAVAGIVPMADVAGACREAERVARLGLRSLFLPSRVLDRPYNDPAYDPFWAVAEASGLPLTFHAGTGHEPRVERGPGGAVINYLLGSQIDGAHVILYLTMAGVLERFPGLRVVTVETGSAWLGWVMTTMDEIYEKHAMWARPKLALRPSDYVRRQCHVTFQNDPVGVHNREFTGVEALVWGSDYPHPEGTWPDSRAALARQLAGVPADEVALMVGGTAARLFGFDR
ncbi:MAG TPA: amidohydrolase family protein [Candidatus Binatia bacterium]|nr:amidohydrolase family protein [Candidatus Binatia bacterium]